MEKGKYKDPWLYNTDPKKTYPKQTYVFKFQNMFYFSISFVYGIVAEVSEFSFLF